VLELQWFAGQFDDLLNRYLRIAVTAEGAFLARFDADWHCLESENTHLVAQSRLIHNFSVGYRVTGRPEYKLALVKGTDFLLHVFWDHEKGGFYNICGRSGIVADDCKASYGQSFALFALAHAALTLHDDRYRQAAFIAWQTIQDRFADQNGGLLPLLTRNFVLLPSLNSQNPLMHLLEALLELQKLDSSRTVHKAVDRLIRFVVCHLRDKDGYLPEIYTADWQPCDRQQGGRIDLGHHFEWAYLLSQAVHLGHAEEFLGVGHQMLNLALANAVDSKDGGVRSPLSMDRSLEGAKKCWWEQCEAIRAILRYIRAHGKHDLEPILEQIVRFVDRYFIDHKRGGWYTCVDGVEIAPADQNKSDYGKVYYHVIGMCLEAFAYFLKGEATVVSRST